METIKNYIKATDFLGGQISFLHDNVNRIKTFLGGLISVILVILTVTLGVYFSRDLFEKTNPFVRSSFVIDQYKKVDYKDQPIFFTVVDRLGNDLTKNKTFMQGLSITGELVVRPETNLEGRLFEVWSYQFQPCNMSDFGELGQNMEKQKFTNFPVYCPNWKQAFNFFGKKVEEKMPYIKGMYLSANSAHFQIRVNKCDEKLNPKCFEEASKIDEIYVSAITSRTVLDTNNFSNPSISRNTGISLQLAKNLYVRKFIRFQFVELITDDGLIFPNEKADNYIDITNISTEVSNYDELNRNLVMFTFESDEFVRRNNRSYLRLQEVFAQISGFFKVLQIIGREICFFFSSYDLLNTINLKPKKKLNLTIKFDNRSKEESGVDLRNTTTEVAAVKFGLCDFLLNLIKLKKNSYLTTIEKEMFECLDIRTYIDRMRLIEEFRKQNEELMN